MTLESANDYDADHYVSVFVRFISGDVEGANKQLGEVYFESIPSTTDGYNQVRVDRAGAKKVKVREGRKDRCLCDEGFITARGVDSVNHCRSRLPSRSLLSNKHEVNIRFSWGFNRIMNYYRDVGKDVLDKDIVFLKQFYINHKNPMDIAKELEPDEKVVLKLNKDIKNLLQRTRGFFR